ncbi:MAG: hypothetical protein HDT42_00780 [Ruminococcaceae bacterium]|nr:hypothetical protein [Oscillospiraceae bacterium]
MDNTIIVALISLVGTLGGSLGGILVSSKLTAYRIEQLEKKVEEHNQFARRMPVVESQLEEIARRVDDLEEYHKGV